MTAVTTIAAAAPARDPIRKQPALLPVAPNLRDYAATCAGFRWALTGAMA